MEHQPQHSIAEEELDLMYYATILNQNKWSVLSLAFLVSILATLIVFSITPVYRASCILLIEAQQTKLPSIEEFYGLISKDKQYYATQLEVLKSHKLATLVVEDLQLIESPYFARHDDATFSPINVLKTWLLLDEKEEKKEESYSQKHARIVSSVQQRVLVSSVGKTQMIKISFEDTNPELAAKISNAFAQSYIDAQRVSRVNNTKQATDWIRERLKVLKKSLDDSEENLQDYKENQVLIDVKGVSTLTAKELDQQTSQFVTASSKYLELSKRYGPKHPKLIAAQSELHTAKRAMVKNKGEIQTIGRKAVKLRELKRQVSSNKQLYDTFLSSLKEANQAINMHQNNIQISDPATIPTVPFKPKKKLVILLSFITSLMMGVLLVFIRAGMDKTFKDPAEVEHKLGLPILGVLPVVQKHGNKKSPLPMLDSNQPIFSEAMRTVRTGLMLSNIDEEHKIVLITSSIPGEGKTIVSANLGVVMSKMERVLLLEADLRNPSLAKVLGLDNAVGVTEVLASSANDYEHAIQHVADENLDVLLCGSIPPNPLELLSSKKFATMIKTLKNHYDRIIIDSPPIQAVSDALVLCKYTDSIVYVIEADATDEYIVQNSIQRLQQYKTPLAGIVFNKFKAKKSMGYGYIDYSYGYDNSYKKS